MRLLKYTLLYK